MLQLVEPENRNLCQDSPLPGDALNATIRSSITGVCVRRTDVFQDNIVSRDPVRGHEQEVVRIRSLIDVAYFALGDELQAGQV